jgi:hypothetical protein
VSNLDRQVKGTIKRAKYKINLTQRAQRAQSFLALHFTSEDGQLGRENKLSRPNIWEQGW